MKLKAILLAFLIFIAAAGSALAERTKKYDLNAILGWAGQAGGIMKSFGYHLINNYISTEVSIAVFQHSYPFSLNLTLQLPLGPVSPYVSAGYGYSLSGFGASNFAAGLKFWVSPNTGLLFDVRRFNYTYLDEKKKTTMFGIGFDYRL